MTSTLGTAIGPRCLLDRGHDVGVRHRVPYHGDVALPEHAIHVHRHDVVSGNLRGQREASVDEMSGSWELLGDPPPVRIKESDPSDPHQVTVARCGPAARVHDALYSRAPCGCAERTRGSTGTARARSTARRKRDHGNQEDRPRSHRANLISARPARTTSCRTAGARIEAGQPQLTSLGCSPWMTCRRSRT